jgi:hypothetical protein
MQSLHTERTLTCIKAQFNWNNTAVNVEWPMTRGEFLCYDASSMMGPSFDGSKQLSCSSEAAFAPGFKFDYNTSTLWINQRWRCDGMDRDHS